MSLALQGWGRTEKQEALRVALLGEWQTSPWECMGMAIPPTSATYCSVRGRGQRAENSF